MKAVSSLLFLLFFVFMASCDNSTDPEDNYIRATFRQPKDGDTIITPQYNIIMDVVQNCGCTSYAEFYINGELQYTDYIRDFNYLWNTDTLNGEYLIKVHSVVPNKAEDWDSVRVTVVR